MTFGLWSVYCTIYEELIGTCRALIPPVYIYDTIHFYFIMRFINHSSLSSSRRAVLWIFNGDEGWLLSVYLAHTTTICISPRHWYLYKGL